MFTRIATAVAVGAAVFGIAGAGASMLTVGGSGAVVQQSNALTATCENPGNLQYDNVVTVNDLTSTRLFQQSVDQYCGGDFAQVAVKLTNGDVVYSNKVWIPTSNVTSASQEAFLLGGSTDLAQYGYAVYGEDLYPQFPANVCATEVKSTILTIAGQINSPGSNTAGAVIGADGSPTTLPGGCSTDPYFNKVGAA